MADWLPRARQYLIESDEFKALVADGIVGVDEPGTGPWLDGWLFVEGLYVQPEGTTKAAVVMNSTRGWGATSRFHTDVSPVLEFKIYSDPARDADRFQADRTGRQRALRVVQVIDSLFHDVASQVSDFDCYPILSCLRGTEWSYSAVPDGDGMVLAEGSYDVWLAA